MAGEWTSGPLYPGFGDIDSDMQGTVYNEKLYVCGGHEGTFSDDHDQHYYFDPATYSWVAVANMPLGGEGNMGGVTVGDYMYYVGGSSGLYGNAVSTFWRYDPNADTWNTSLTPLPEARSRGAVGAAGNKIYYGGGITGTSTMRNTLYEYDIDLNTWTLKTNPPSQRYEVTGAGSNGQFFMVCGYDGAGARTSTVFAYDPVGEGWGEVGAHTPAKSNLARSSFSKGSLIFLQGGLSADGNADTDFQTYNTGTNVLEALTDCPTPYGEQTTQGLLNYNGERYYVVLRPGAGASTDIYTTSDYGSLYGEEFVGTDGLTIYPAPEPVPYRLNLRDFPNMPPTTIKKLNDNFDVIERQLLALDPDSPDRNETQ